MPAFNHDVIPAVRYSDRGINTIPSQIFTHYNSSEQDLGLGSLYPFLTSSITSELDMW